MKDEFFGFYQPSKEEIDKAWTEGTFIFDANALLNLYRYSDSTRRDFLLAIEKIEERLFMPYQIGFEFHSNRNSVIETLENSYSSLQAGIREVFEKNIKSLLNQFKRHPSIELDNLIKLQDAFLKDLTTELERQKKSHPDFLTNDEILNKLTEFYRSKVGDQFSKDELKKIYLEGKERYEQRIPPGYKDQEAKKNKGDQSIYGDLIIWKQIISIGLNQKKPIVFVTDDRKEDWWTIENGRTIRPKEELIKEFHDLTKVRILIYNADQFLSYAKDRRLVTKIKDTSINEIKEVRRNDESFNAISQLRASNFSKIQTSINDYLKSDAYKINSITSNLSGPFTAIPNIDAFNAAVSQAVFPSAAVAGVINAVSQWNDVLKVQNLTSSINPALLTSLKIAEHIADSQNKITLEESIMNNDINRDIEENKPDKE